MKRISDLIHGGREAVDEPTRAVPLDDAALRARLDPLAYDVLRNAATERPFTGAYVDVKEPGVYRCAACEAELFRSDAKFESGSGWPSFDQPAFAESVELRDDTSHFMRRTEALCKACGSHLGHVFPDGPTATGDRYCINSCALDFRPADAEGTR